MTFAFVAKHLRIWPVSWVCEVLDEPGQQRLAQLGDGELLSSLKTERTARKVYRTRYIARADVFDYIERFYNPRRRHLKLG